MAKEDQNDFKQSLLAYDKIFDTKTKQIVEDAEQERWVNASNSLNELNGACISCHAMWRQKVKR